MNVLIVDDNYQNLYMLESYLKGSGYEVVSAVNGIEALEKLKAGFVDIIISDILMPEMDGFQLCWACKQNESLSRIPFLFYSSTYTDKKDMEFALSLGADRFVIKPQDPEKLTEIINEVLQERRECVNTVSSKAVKEESVYLIEYNKRLVEKLESKVNELEREISERKKLEKAVLEIEERERRLIGQDLHDDLGQLLTAMAYKNHVLQQKLKDKLYEETRDIDEMTSLISMAQMRLKKISRGISPIEMDRDGLARALEELASSTGRIYNISSVFMCDQPIHIKNEAAITHLYRIAQETVTNAVRHGNPAHIEIQFKMECDKIVLTIEDDGTGIPVSFKTNGMGMRIMNFRANMIGATLEVLSNNNGGTLVKCVFTDST